MIILAPGALDKVFSAETSATCQVSSGSDSRFSNWLKSSHDVSVSNSSSDSATRVSAAYRNRLTRFE